MKTNKVILYIAFLLIPLVVATLSCTFTIVDLKTQEIVLISFHNRYVTAKASGENWSLKQELELSSCGTFTLHHLKNDKVTLKTCHDRYVTAPENGSEREEWLLRQDSELSDCGQFTLHELENGRVAFETCAGNFFTAGADDEFWSSDLEWSIVGETDEMKEWEEFTMLKR